MWLQEFLPIFIKKFYVSRGAIITDNDKTFVVIVKVLCDVLIVVNEYDTNKVGRDDLWDADSLDNGLSPRHI